MVGKLCGTFSVKQRLHEPQIYQALVEKCTNRSDRIKLSSWKYLKDGRITPTKYKNQRF